VLSKSGGFSTWRSGRDRRSLVGGRPGAVGVREERSKEKNRIAWGGEKRDSRYGFLSIRPGNRTMTVVDGVNVGREDKVLACKQGSI